MDNSVLFDNWGLALANWALSQVPSHDGEPPKRTNLSYRGIGVTEFEGLSVWEDWIGVMALADLLDALVFYDTVVYPEPHSNWWLHRFDGLQPLLSHIQQAQVDTDTMVRLRQASEQLSGTLLEVSRVGGIVSEGSIFYLLLGSLLETPYQPSPKRADFVSSVFTNPSGTDSAQQHLLRFFDAASVQLCAEIQNAIGLRLSAVRVPVVASYIFSEVKAKEEIAPLLLQIRASSERRALTTWLAEGNQLLTNGNVAQYVKHFQAVRDVFEDLRKTLGLKESESATVSLGLSPSLDMSTSALSGWFRRRKPYTVLVKRFAEHLLSSRTYAKDVHRLFGMGQYYAKSMEERLRRRLAP